MLKYTVGDFIGDRGSLDVGPEYRIYRIRDRETVFYVGQSVDVVKRVRTHLQSNSELGEFLKARQPRSLRWAVEFLTVAECRTPLETLLDLERHGHPWHQLPGAVDLAEVALITLFRPRFNSRGNPDAPMLPEDYGWLDRNEKRALRDQVSY